MSIRIYFTIQKMDQAKKTNSILLSITASNTQIELSYCPNGWALRVRILVGHSVGHYHGSPILSKGRWVISRFEIGHPNPYQQKYFRLITPGFNLNFNRFFDSKQFSYQLENREIVVSRIYFFGFFYLILFILRNV